MKVESRKQLLPPLAVSFAGAALVIWLYFGGEAIETAILAQAGREAIIAAIWDHVGWGVVMTPLLLVYIFLRISHLRVKDSSTLFVDKASSFICWLLTAVLVFLVVTGPIIVWTYGSDLKVFNWFVVPTPTGKLPIIHDPLEAAHILAAKAAPWLAGLDVFIIAVRSIIRR